MDRNRAAFLIQSCFKKRRADVTRREMINRGDLWRSYSGDMIRDIGDNVKKLNELTLRKRPDGRSELTRQEFYFLSRFMRTEFYATHATSAPDVIDARGNLILYSYRKLMSMGGRPQVHEKTHIDRAGLGNDDYVFFSLEAGKSLQKPASRFGNTIYRVRFCHFAFLYADLLLVDQLMSWPYSSLIKHFPSIYHAVDNRWQSLSLSSVHFIGGRFNNVLLNLAKSILLIARELNETDKRELLAINTDEDVNILMNSVFRPEIRVPVMAVFRPGEFEKRSISQLPV